MRRAGATIVGRAALLGVALFGAGCGSSEGPAGLLLITIDTCRADRIGAYGAAQANTPNLDELAAAGTLFEQTGAPVPLTLPSHCTILTGLYPDRHGIRDNGQGRLPREAVTLAEIAEGAGWRAGAFVSAFPLASEFGTDQGFGVYDEDLAGTSAGRLGNSDAQDVAERLFYDERRAGDTAAEAAEWMRDAIAAGEPFVAWVHFFDPHANYLPPPGFIGPGMDAYDGEIAYVDQEIGKLLEALGSSRERTTVVVTADHGESLGEHGEVSHGLFTYESTLRVPWILRGPRVPIGERVLEPVSLADVLPTSLDAIGLDVPPGLDGATRLPLARGEGEAPDYVYGENQFPRLKFDWAGLRTIRRGDWKLIEAPRPELYHLGEDPNEMRNRADEFPELVDDLRGALRDLADRGGRLGAEEVTLDAAARERLERLGYVGSSGGGADGDEWNLEGKDPKDMIDFFNRLQEIPTVFMDGRYEDGERILDDLLRQDPGNLSVIEKLALLERLRENWDAAIRWCEAFLEQQPDHGQTYVNIAYAERQRGDDEAAIRAYQAALVVDPEDADSHALLGALQHELGRTTEAREAYDRTLALNPEDLDIWVARGNLRKDQGDAAGAAADFDRALELNPKASGAVNSKALLLSHSGRPEQAVDVLRGAIDALAADLDTRNNLAWILANENLDATEALVHAREARRLAPDDPAVLDTFGWAAIRAGAPEQAIEPLRRALALTGDAEVRAHLGIALAEAGNAAEGRPLVRQAVAERASLLEIPEVGKWR